MGVAATQRVPDPRLKDLVLEAGTAPVWADEAGERADGRALPRQQQQRSDDRAHTAVAQLR